MRSLQVITVMLAALTMGLAVAHALEHPGKMRLNREDYLSTQTIYSPGFTIGGYGEPLGVLAALALVFATPCGAASFWWSVAGFIGLAIVHAIFWTVTQPVNRYWAAIRMPSGAPLDQWKQFRGRWEHSHIVRAVFATASLICITIALALS
jgi:uncharacterized membrane protein